MTLQSTVYSTLGHGVPGELAFDTPLRATPGTIDPAATAANCVMGRYFTKSRTTGLYRPGGDTATDTTLIFGGIAGSPKSAIAYGVGTDPFAASLALAPGDTTDFFEMATPWIRVTAAALIGDIVAYDIVTGQLFTYAPGATIPAGRLAVPNAVVYRVGTSLSGGDVICVKLTN